MSALEPQPEPASGSSSPGASSASSTPARTPESGRIRPARLWTTSMVAGLLAALASWLAGEATQGAFVPPPEAMVPGPLGGTTPEMLAAQMATDIKNAALNHGLFGAILGLSLGLAGGGATASGWKALRASAAGLVLGAGAAAGVAAALTPVFHRAFNPASPTLILPLLILGGIWTATGAACGLAFGLGLGGRASAVRGLLGGAAGAGVATVVFQLIYAVAFPLERNEQVVLPTWPTRLLGLLCVAMLTAAGATWAYRTPKESPDRFAPP
jgi:hypothetical protein